MTISNDATAYFRVYWEDGEHNYEVENFETKDEAVKCFMSEVEKFKANPGEYTGQNPEEWTYGLDGEECYYPTFYVDYVDEDDSNNDIDINDFDLNRGFFNEVQS